MSKRESIRARRIVELESELQVIKIVGDMEQREFIRLCDQLNIDHDSEWKDVRDAVRELLGRSQEAESQRDDALELVRRSFDVMNLMTGGK